MSAAPSEKKITINATDYRQLITSDTVGSNNEYTGRAFKAIQLAKYVTTEVGTDSNKGYTLDLETTLTGNELTALKTDLHGVDSSYATTSTTDPMKYVNETLKNDSPTPTAGDKTVRQLADKLGADTTITGTTSAITLSNNKVTKDANNGGTMVLDFSSSNAAVPGIYLLIDNGGEHTFDSKTYKASKPIIVGTKTNPTASTPSSCTITNGDGTVNMKSESVNLAGFEFTKVQADGTTGLAGAKFVISKTDSGTTHYGKYTASTSSWDWTSTTQPTEKTGNTDNGEDAGVFESAATTGKVTFPNLAAGSYTVTEIVVPSGYLQSVKPSFTITNFTPAANAQGTTSYQVTGTGTFAGLVLGTKNGNDNFYSSDVKVKNVTSITQLPLTGAAGTVLFTVVAVLLAGAAVTVSLKSRSTKRALRA